MNRKSGKVLTQTANGAILAVSFDPKDPAHRWIRVSAGQGFYAYKNVMTDNVLDHWYAEKGRGNVVAKNGDCGHINHQWYERDVEDIFIALQSRKSHCMLDHYFSDDVRVAPDDDPTYHERQWCLIYHREVTEEVIRTVALKNVRSGNLLTHADTVDAVDDHLELAMSQGSRIPVGGYSVYQNVTSEMVLSHTEQGVGAFNNNKSDKRSHWFECILSKGYVALKNRHPGHVLDHFLESSIRATDQKIGCLNDLWQIVYDLPSNWRPAAPVDSPSPWIIRPESVMLTSVIGEGSFGKVYHCKWSECDVVVKMINFARTPPPPKEMESFLKEVKLWAELRHSNIVPFCGANLDQTPFSIVSEYAANGTLDHYLA